MGPEAWESVGAPLRFTGWGAGFSMFCIYTEIGIGGGAWRMGIYGAGLGGGTDTSGAGVACSAPVALAARTTRAHVCALPAFLSGHYLGNYAPPCPTPPQTSAGLEASQLHPDAHIGSRAPGCSGTSLGTRACLRTGRRCAVSLADYAEYGSWITMH